MSGGNILRPILPSFDNRKSGRSRDTFNLLWYSSVTAIAMTHYLENKYIHIALEDLITTCMVRRWQNLIGNFKPILLSQNVAL